MRSICLVGRIARIHVEVLDRMPEVSVMVVADPSFGAAKVLARLLPGARPTGSAEGARPFGRFDAAPVLTPIDSRAAIAVPLLEQAMPFMLADKVAVAILGALRAVGRCCNLVGDVRSTARECLACLAAATDRSLGSHPRLPATPLGEKGAIWPLTRAGGQRLRLFSWRDLLTRSLSAADPAGFREAAFATAP
jgi:hypothetical protein